MNNSIFDELKLAFSKTDNGLIQLILINLIVFVVLMVLEVILMLSGSASFYETIVSWLTIPADVGAFIRRPWTIVTYFFTHESFFHILFNMLFLYWFGRIVQEYLGNRRLVNLYILGGLVGGLFYIAIYNLIPYYANQVGVSAMLGASAGVFAVVTGAATLVPNYTMQLLLIGAVRIKYIAIFYILVSFSGITGTNAGGNLAHLGGALIGFLFIKQLQAGTDLGKPITIFLDVFRGLFKRKPHLNVTYRRKTEKAAAPAAGGRTHTAARSTAAQVTQDEIDIILDKISQSGYESLSKEEKQKLFSASQK